MKAYLLLANGMVFEGRAFGAAGTSVGEVVFNTGMVGYEETLTDPSYYGQIITQTYPLVGNYGVNGEDAESARIWAFGYIVRELCGTPSNFRCQKTLDEFLKEQGIIGIAGVDTRRLTRIIRESGVMNGALTTEYKSADAVRADAALMEKIKAYTVKDAVDSVTTKCMETFNENGKYHVALFDFGYKRNILRNLVKRGCKVTLVPGRTTAAELAALEVDGVMLSNGPGDPAENVKIIENLKEIAALGRPVFGICLGHQLMALATGEVMAIANSFEHAFMKAVQSIELGLETPTLETLSALTDEEVVEKLHVCDSDRSFVVYEAIKRGVSFETIYNITKIDPWFLAKLQGLAETELALAGLRGGILTEELYRTAKMQGFLDKTVLRLTGLDALPCEKLRASYKMVDTCAAEFSAKTPYFYSTFDEENEAAQFIAEHPSDRKKVLVFGSGPIRIGQGIEFDYCSVHCTWVLKSHGCEAVIVNNNPETVSTDFDTGDRLYFDPLTEESVEHIIATEKPWACVVQFGGQTAIKLTKHLTKLGVKILGTSADAIDEAEDRERFDALLEKCGIPRPQGHTVFTCEEALAAGAQLGYPVLLRPSYVLGGQNMIIAYNENDVREYMAIITSHVDMSNPVLVDKYLMGTECEVDAICDGEDFLIPGMMEHIERAGIHSGDSISVYPPQNLKQKIKGTIVDYTGRLARALNVVGLMNIQFVVYNNEVFIIEVNPRSSRTVPYISKVTGVPMVELAVRCMLGEKLRDMGYGTGLYPTGDYCAVKVPVFSFEKLHDVDTQLGPEMKSTGEVLGIDKTFEDALLKGLVGAGYSLRQPTPGKCVILTVKDADKRELVDIAWQLKDMGYKLYGTSGTAYYLGQNMVACNEVRKLSEARPNIMDLFESGLVDYVISTSSKGRIPSHDSVKMRRKAVELSIPCLTAIDTAQVLVKCLRSGKTLADVDLVDISTI